MSEGNNYFGIRTAFSTPQISHLGALCAIADSSLHLITHLRLRFTLFTLQRVTPMCRDRCSERLIIHVCDGHATDGHPQEATGGTVCTPTTNSREVTIHPVLEVMVPAPLPNTPCSPTVVCAATWECSPRDRRRLSAKTKLHGMEKAK